VHGRCRKERFQDFGRADQVCTFGNLKLLFQELVYFESSFRVLLEDVFLQLRPKIWFRKYFLKVVGDVLKGGIGLASERLP
jgi:hypothetical protein